MAVPSHLPREAEEFILKYIDSLEELEILLLVRSDPQRLWTAESVLQEIKSSSESVVQRLGTLAAKGLLQTTDAAASSYQYHPATAQLGAAVESLAAAYKERRLRVLECLFSKPLSSLRVFADAFKIRKDPNHG